MPKAHRPHAVVAIIAANGFIPRARMRSGRRVVRLQYMPAYSPGKKAKLLSLHFKGDVAELSLALHLQHYRIPRL